MNKIIMKIFIYFLKRKQFFFRERHDIRSFSAWYFKQLNMHAKYESLFVVYVYGFTSFYVLNNRKWQKYYVIFINFNYIIHYFLILTDPIFD